MKSISQAQHKKILLVLLAISILLFSISLFMYIDSKNILSLSIIENELSSIFDEDYKIEFSKVSDTQFVVDVMSDKDEIVNHTDNINKFKANLSNYKIKLNEIDRIILQVGREIADTKHIDNRDDIDLSKIK